MTKDIHPTALVDHDARIGEGVVIGPYAVVGGGVDVGCGTSIGAHSVLQGNLSIGCDNYISNHVSLGAPAQHRSLSRPGEVRIGSGNTIREFVTVHQPTTSGLTTIGDNGYFMAYVHIAHDNHIGSNVTIANATQLAGRVRVDHHATFGLSCVVHQHCRVGAHAMVGMNSVVVKDVPPCVVFVAGRAVRLNTMGLERAGFDDDDQDQIRNALMYGIRPAKQRLLDLLGSVGQDQNRQSYALSDQVDR